MCETFLYSTTTTLGRERTWKLLSDIENWMRASDVYAHMEWSGEPWIPGSVILGTINYPVRLSFRYVLERCGLFQIAYLAHSMRGGFATHRVIELEESRDGGTVIRVNSFIVGEPDVPGGGIAFLKMITERWFHDFARFCDLRQKSAVA